MRASYDYFYTQQAVGRLDLEDIGNCTLKANTDDGREFYLVIRTKLGVTRVLEFGPHMNGGFPTVVNSTFQQFDYNEARIDKAIYRFLNNQKATITQAMEEEIENIAEYIINPLDLMQLNLKTNTEKE